MKSTLILATIIVAASSFISFTRPAARVMKRGGEDPVGTVYVVVDKSDYELKIFDDEGWYATYPVVFGSKDLSDKMYEGDKRTPEGNFKIISKKPHDKWHKMFMLDYPNAESWAKFKARKAAGKIPAKAKIGGGIAIHGTWKNDDIVVDDFTNWTNGCISVKNEDLDELDRYLPVGTKVTIQR
jgi:murein L,D-transpeptidase YafK